MLSWGLYESQRKRDFSFDADPVFVTVELRATVNEFHDIFQRY